MLPLLIPAVCFLVPPLFVAAAMWIDVDGIYFLLEMILPDPMYRDRNYIYGALACRFILLFWSFEESCRIIGLICCVGYLWVDRAGKIITVLRTRVINFSGFYRYYIYLTLLFQRIREIAEYVLYCLLTILFWATVASCWICVKGTVNQITLPFYISFFVTAIASTTFFIITIPLLCGTLDAAAQVIYENYIRSRFRCVKVNSVTEKIELMKVQAVRPIGIKYGIFHDVDSDFAMEFFSLIVLRIFDVILVLDFQ